MVCNSIFEKMCMLYKIINLYKFVIYSRHLAIVKCLIFIKGGNLMNNYSVEHESTFSRNVANIGKAGAYYTDTEHCRRIGKLIKFPAEFNLLEPSIGDGSAVLSLLGENRNKANLYGVEINADSYSLLEQKSICNYLLNADFLNDVRISKNSFSIMFANPPYGEYKDNIRYEQAFEEKAFSYLCKEALLVYVIPYYVLTQEKFIKSFFARYFPLATYRFDDSEYEKWKQVVVFARKRSQIAYMKSDLISYIESIEPTNLEYLPENVDKLFEVYESRDENVKTFSNLSFNAAAFLEVVDSSPILSEFGRNCGDIYKRVAAGNPALPLSKENAYMLGVCGAGSGLAGSEDEGTLHLQRGVVENVTTTSTETDENGVDNVVQRTMSSTSMHIIDAQMNYYELK